MIPTESGGCNSSFPLQVAAEPSAVPSNNLMLCLQELFTCIEEVYEEGQSIGNPEKFFALVENSMEAMPVSAILCRMMEAMMFLPQ